MVTIVKHEWHQVDEQYAFELDEETLSNIYPDLDVGEIVSLMVRIGNGEVSIEEILDDAYNNDVDIDWEHQYSDCWTSRKGGYDVTFELGDEDSWVTPEKEPEHTHKCTKCKWTGQSYDAEWSWEDKEGNEIEDPRKICPYCESDTELTEHGIKEEKEQEERRKKWEKDE
jgi:hypothetical protein